jgi:hypothetical protein
LERIPTTMSTKSSNSISSATRDEKRKAYARANKLYQDEKARKRKEWLANHPEVAAQEAREKEERRLNNETLRMLASMKEEPVKKKKILNAFAALCDDSDTEEEEEEEDTPVVATETVTETKEEKIVFNAGKRFDWAEDE